MNARDLRLSSLLLLLFAPFAAAQIQIESVSGFDAVASEALVKPRPGVSISQLAAAFKSDSITPLGKTGWFRVHSPAFAASALVNAASSSALVAASEPNYIVRATDTVPNDPSLGSLWGLRNTGQTINGQVGIPQADISAVKAWDITTGSSGILVGIIDSGVDYNHGDLAANIWSAPAPYTLTFGANMYNCPAGSHGFNAINMSCDPLDDNNHGTHVAGTIGARGNNSVGVAGVNWNTSIIAVKFLDSSGLGSISDAVNAIEAAVQLKSLGYNIRVLNASWGTDTTSTPLQLAISDANSNDMLFVAAAGNGSSNNDGETPAYPASFKLPNIIAVAATDNRDQLASFSNYGAGSVHLGAPGVYVLSTITGGNYAFFSGTSMATPHVAGSAALVLSRCSLTTANLKNVILSSVDPVAALNGRTVTGGRLNVFRALQQCGGAPSSPDFQLSANPAGVTVTQGNSSFTTLTIQPVSGFSGSVQLSAQALPTGITASFSPSTVTSSGTSTLTLTSAAGAAAGSYAITVQGVSGSITHSTSIALTVATQPDFTITASPSTLSVAAGAAASSTLNIAALAGFTGQVSLTAQNLPSGVTASFAPSTITGSGTSTLTLSSTAATAAGSYSITVQAASGSVSHATALAFTVASSPAILLSLQSPIDVGSSAALTITLPAPAPASGMDIALATSNPAVAGINLASLFLPGGQSSTSRVRISGLSAGQSTITVTANGYQPASTLVQIGSQTSTMSFSPASLTLATGATQSLTLSLSTPAPSSGLTVSLSSGNSAVASVPLTVVVPGSASSVAVPVTAQAVGSATITASAPNYSAATASVTVTAFSSALVITTTSLATGQAGQPYSQTLGASGGTKPYTWSFTGSLPSGLNFNAATGLISGTPLAAASAVLGFRVTDSSTPALSAATALSLVVNPQSAGESITLPSSLNLAVGADAALLIQVSSPAPAGGLDLTLAISNPAIAGVNLTSLFLPAGQSSTTRARVSGLASGQSTITVSAAGYAAASVTVQVGSQTGTSSMSFSPPSVTLAPGAAQSLTLSLSSPAPSLGLTVSLSSSNASVASVAPSIAVPGNATSVGVPVTAGALGSTTITATAPNYSAATAGVTVTASSSTLVITTASLAIGQVGQFYSQTLAASGGTRPYTWSFNGLLPAGLNFDQATGLISGNPLAGANALLTFRVVDSSAPAQSAIVTLPLTINAQAAGSIILPSALNLAVGTDSALAIQLSTPAPAGGLDITITTSNPAVAGPNITALFLPAGQSSTTRARISGLSAGQSTIAVSASGYTSATVLVQVGN